MVFIKLRIKAVSRCYNKRGSADKSALTEFAVIDMEVGQQSFSSKQLTLTVGNCTGVCLKNAAAL